MAKCPLSRGDYIPVKAGELSTELSVEMTVVHSDCCDLVDKVIREVTKDEHNATEVAGAS